MNTNNLETLLTGFFSIPVKQSQEYKQRQEQLASARGKSGAAMRKAKTLAQAHGIEIDREEAGRFWVTHPDLVDTDRDPLEGRHFCTDGEEVLEAVQVYASHLTGEAK